MTSPPARATPAPLVTLHGGPGATHDYLLSMTDLAGSGRAVVFYDQTGNGKSTHFPDRGAEFYTVSLFVRELASLVEHLGIGDRYHVLGQSWGGMLAQEHAITRPPGLRSVILSNTAASFAGFAVEANGLRAGLPPEAEATLRRHEAAGTTDDPEYADGVRGVLPASRMPDRPVAGRGGARLRGHRRRPDRVSHHQRTVRVPHRGLVQGLVRARPARDASTCPCWSSPGGTTRPRRSCKRN